LKKETAFSVTDIKTFKIKMLNWCQQFSIFCLLDNHHYDFEEPAFECMLAAGCKRSFTFTSTNSFAELQHFFDQKPSWLFGHLGYNAAQNAYYNNPKKNIDFGDGFLFEPEIIIKLTAKNVIIFCDADKNAADIFQAIKNEKVFPGSLRSTSPPAPCISKEKYIDAVKKLQQHIKAGDCYEINYCLNFSADHVQIFPTNIYQKLTSLSPNPFGAFYKLNDKYCFCASPERFLKKTGNKIISQPIKGTSRRDHLHKENDAANKAGLQKSEKEKSENVMIVDLVRNDLSIVAETGTVKVKELFGLYSFPQVHQMISTVECILAADKSFTDALLACYPPGSMTGAPKKKVMELIEIYEPVARDLFSGSIGYITPDADFDFNVVIRSIFYDETKKEIDLFAGSGITFYADAANEYDECMAKAEPLVAAIKS
jgi:para-aminobenzoate synthetase component I